MGAKAALTEKPNSSIGAVFGALPRAHRRGARAERGIDAARSRQRVPRMGWYRVRQKKLESSTGAGFEAQMLEKPQRMAFYVKFACALSKDLSPRLIFVSSPGPNFVCDSPALKLDPGLNPGRQGFAVCELPIAPACAATSSGSSQSPADSNPDRENKLKSSCPSRRFAGLVPESPRHFRAANASAPLSLALS